MLTEAEWQQLDTALARKPMGWFKWDELPNEIQAAYWTLLEEEPDDFWLPYLREAWWSVKDSQPYREWQIHQWRPHIEIDQAMMVKDAIVKRGWCFDLQDREGKWHCVYLWQMYDEPTLEMHGDSDAKAICLAAKAWSQRKKEENSE